MELEQSSSFSNKSLIPHTLACYNELEIYQGWAMTC